MLFTADIGNTNIVLTIFNTDKVVFESRLCTSPHQMADQYALTILDLFRLYGVNPGEITGAIISSVVPPVTAQFKAAVERLFSISVMVVGPGLKTGLNIKTDDPSTLGSDICCAAVAAKNIYPLPCIFIDMGTVIKIMALDKYGALIGGAFFPGINVGLKALSEHTASLPLVTADKSDRPIGRSTIECIKSGMLYGTGAMLDGMIFKMTEELTGKCAVVATGGFSEAIRPFCRTEFVTHPYLVSEGLRLIYNRNLI